MTLTYATARTDADLDGILELQRKNWLGSLAAAESASQGFVTVRHTPAVLRALHAVEPHVVAKDGEHVAAYVLAMTAASRDAVPLLVPMFEAFDAMPYRGRPIAASRYMVVGQVCVDKAHRGSGAFGALYAKYRDIHAPRYELAVTEIAVANARSMRAHARVGFEAIDRYTAPDGVEWIVVAWPWR